MRVLHLIESLEFGGAEKVAIDLANAMAERHEVTICCVKQVGDLGGTVDSRIRVLCLNKREGNDYFVPFRLAQILRKFKIDVLHAHNWGVYLEASLASLLARTQVAIHTVHGPYLDYLPGWRPRLKRTIRHTLERLFSPRFAKIVTVSDSIQEYIRDEIGIAPTRLLTVHNGIKTQGIQIAKKESRETRCITVGRLAEVKNQAMMIRAFHAADCETATLYLVGDGPERTKLVSLLRELGIEDRVVITGFRQDVSELLAQSDIFLMSSNYEGISIAVLEAMRAGLPVIGTNVGGMAETVKPETGFLVAAGDISAMADAIRSLLRSPMIRSSLGTAGRKFLEAEFSIDQMVARYELLYGGKR